MLSNSERAVKIIGEITLVSLASVAEKLMDGIYVPLGRLGGN